jgi:hypothetical protein
MCEPMRRRSSVTADNWSTMPPSFIESEVGHILMGPLVDSILSPMNPVHNSHAVSLTLFQ